MKKTSLLLYAIFLFSMLLTACGSNTPTPLSYDTETLSAIQSAMPEASLTNTPFPTETLTPTFIPPEPLDRTNIESVLKWISYAIIENKPEMVSDVIGSRGVQFGGRYLGSVVFPEFNNSEFIVTELEKGLQNTTPHCAGYITYLDASPDKAFLFFSNIRFPWDNDVSKFSFFNSEGGWELVVIVEVPEELWANEYQTLWACP